jgi:hypothetical protein
MRYNSDVCSITFIPKAHIRRDYVIKEKYTNITIAYGTTLEVLKTTKWFTQQDSMLGILTHMFAGNNNIDNRIMVIRGVETIFRKKKQTENINLVEDRPYVLCKIEKRHKKAPPEIVSRHEIYVTHFFLHKNNKTAWVFYSSQI